MDYYTPFFIKKTNKQKESDLIPKKKIERKNVLRKQNNSNTTFHRELLPPHHDHE